MSILVTSWICSPLGSSVYGILWARILEWVAIPFSEGLDPGLLRCMWSLALQADSSLTEPPVVHVELLSGV